MQTIELSYGRSAIPFEFDPSRFEVIGCGQERPAIGDAEIGNRLENPIGTPPIEELVKPGERVLIAVPDATRISGAAEICNLLIRRLIAAGIEPSEIRIIFATGIHRPVSEAEKAEILGDFIARRIVSQSHNARDLAGLVRLGETAGGIPIELNRALVEYSRVITVSSVGFHYFAGFTGGRKIVCPGLASQRTINETHRLAFDFERKERADGVAPGRLDGNPVNDAFIEAASARPPDFSINSLVNARGEITDVFCGDWIAAHRAACETLRSRNTIQISEKRKSVIVSCGGFPFDINMIQAHKALVAAAKACQPGGSIVLIAECSEGLGRADFADWFSAENSRQLAEMLTRKYQVNGQTAWSLLRIAEEFDVRIISSLPASLTEKMRLTAMQSLVRAAAKLPDGPGYIMPFGTQYIPEAASK